MSLFIRKAFSGASGNCGAGSATGIAALIMFVDGWPEVKTQDFIDFVLDPDTERVIRARMAFR